MVKYILDIAFQGFWSWFGVFILVIGILNSILRFVFKSWNRFMRMIMVRKHGWPPSHLDADGDWNKEQ